MGLHITVGALADLEKNDKESTSFIYDDFIEINNTLTDYGLSNHYEPKSCKVLSLCGYGYYGLHALREVAGMVWKNKPIPNNKILTGKESSYNDELIEAIYLFLGDKSGKRWFNKLKPKRFNPVLPPFMHLMIHSDAGGYYVPIDFSIPLMPKDSPKEYLDIWPLGSVQQLSKEIDVLIKALNIPDYLGYQSEIFEKLFEGDRLKNHNGIWSSQPIAAYSALILQEACKHSMKTGAAIAFS